MMMTKQEFGRRLDAMIRDRDLDLASFARLANLPRNNVSSYVNGRSYPSEASLRKLADALGMGPEALLPGAADFHRAVRFLR